MIPEKIRSHIEKLAKKEGWIENAEELTDELIVQEVLDDPDFLKDLQLVSEHRWYDRIRKVALVDGMFISFIGYKTKGDIEIPDPGYEEDSVAEVKPQLKTITITEYIPMETN